MTTILIVQRAPEKQRNVRYHNGVVSWKVEQLRKGGHVFFFIEQVQLTFDGADR
jgi:hypothetical protein